jgi:hypothetical protein
MAPRVAGHVEDLRHGLAEAIGVALADRHLDARNARGVGARAHDGAARRLLQRQVAAGMVAVVVRVEDVGEPPAARPERREHRRRLGGIDHRRRLGRGIAGEPEIIVPKRRDAHDLEFRHGPGR